VTSLGNLSGDGVGDLAVGAGKDDDGGTNRGAAWILFLDRALCSDGAPAAGEQCDDGNLADGDGCSGACQIEVADSWEFFGFFTAGTVRFNVNGVPLQVPTLPGETAEEVASKVADAINADPTLSQAAVFGFATASTVVTNGLITGRLVTIAIPVPALTGWGLGLLSLLLGATAFLLARGSAPRT
jgi:cysteine-rich repeat protein